MKPPRDAYPGVPREVFTSHKHLLTPTQYAQAGTEHAEQVALFMWAADEARAGRYPQELVSMFAIPNGGLRSKATAGRLKAEGVKKGVSDIFLPVIRYYIDSVVKFPAAEGLGVYPDKLGFTCLHGLFVEMKPLKSGRATEEQEDFIALMKSRGYAATICRGWIEASQVISCYLNLRA